MFTWNNFIRTVMMLLRVMGFLIELVMLGQFMALVLIMDAYGLLLSMLLLQWGKGEEIVNLYEVTEDPRFNQSQID
ncbi:hypothetical protein C5167_004066 [Papaver somniferum]|nr:hypothetical protein C5167_004066 [Papaver somniferum]